MVKIAVLVKTIWLLILCQIVAADEDNVSSAYFITQENKRLASHLVKKIKSTSLMSCCHSCLRHSWCTSTNFKEFVGQSDKESCELNKHEFAPNNDDSKLIDQPGTTFTMMLKGCVMTGCLNGGSCLFDKKKETFTCSCQLQWSGDKCEVNTCQAVGVADKNEIPDDRMTASTYSSMLSSHPYYGRLNGIRGPGAWCPNTSKDRTDYLQVDMGAVPRSVCAVETQGESKGFYWTKSFKLQFSLDGVTWKYYKEHNAEKMFNGNKEKNGTVHNPFITDVQARYVRFYPVTFELNPCLRVEIYVRK